MVVEKQKQIYIAQLQNLHSHPVCLYLDFNSCLDVHNPRVATRLPAVLGDLQVPVEAKETTTENLGIAVIVTLVLLAVPEMIEETTNEMTTGAIVSDRVKATGETVRMTRAPGG